MLIIGAIVLLAVIVGGFWMFSNTGTTVSGTDVGVRTEVDVAEGAPVSAEGNVVAPSGEVIPDMEYSECIAGIQVTNPEMSDSDARDNCITIEAANQNDASLCNDITNPQIKQDCLALF